MKFNKFVWAGNKFARKRNVPATLWILGCDPPPTSARMLMLMLWGCSKINTAYITVWLHKLENAAVFPSGAQFRP